MNAIIEHKKEWHPDDELRALEEDLYLYKRAYNNLKDIIALAIEHLDADDAIGAYKILNGEKVC